jgi:hypothetical protein
MNKCQENTRDLMGLWFGPLKNSTFGFGGFRYANTRKLFLIIHIRKEYINK